MDQFFDPLFALARPLTNPLLALLVSLLLSRCRSCQPEKKPKWILLLVAASAGFFLLHWLLCLSSRGSSWLLATESPLVAVFLLLILPAICIPPGRARKIFLLLPLAIVCLALVSVFENYYRLPTRKWCWFIIRPVWLFAGTASLLILIKPLLSLKHFRFCVRAICLLILAYGGFAFRQSLDDYSAAIDRRPQRQADVMNLSETRPVLAHPGRMTYLPSAPCRFTADGGYLQGCNMELAQRIMQLNWAVLVNGEPSAADLGAVNLALGALLLLLIMSFILARWFCGWLCPLAALGDLLDWGRRLLGLPHLKPSPTVKLSYLFSGASLAGITLLMAKAQPHVDAQQRYAGCKIPLFPFCKICPGQQLCPVAAGGPDAYPGLPTWADWPFFRTFVLILLVIFAISFAAGRRLWCRFCPMGMLSGTFNRGGLMTLRKDPSKCNSCGVCLEVCPMNIDLVRSEMIDTDVTCYDCLLCLKCLEKCPRDGCLSLVHAGTTVIESRFGTGKE
jgi:ferredoxin-type protein NapH